MKVYLRKLNNSEAEAFPSRRQFKPISERSAETTLNFKDKIQFLLSLRGSPPCRIDEREIISDETNTS